MADDEAEIRGPTERWVRAVHTGDMSGVLADHSDRMFDLPYAGVRGIDTYREMWPGFFRMASTGRHFRTDVPGRHRGTPWPSPTPGYGHPQQLAEQLDLRLRLTLGLCKERGRWVVARYTSSSAIHQ
jgi:hypothetical protein